MITLVPARCAGIPCLAEVCVTPGAPALYGRGGLMEEPEELEQVEVIRLLDRRGRPAHWLEAKGVEPELIWPARSWDDDL